MGGLQTALRYLDPVFLKLVPRYIRPAFLAADNDADFFVSYPPLKILGGAGSGSLLV